MTQLLMFNWRELGTILDFTILDKYAASCQIDADEINKWSFTGCPTNMGTRSDPILHFLSPRILKVRPVLKKNCEKIFQMAP